MAPTYCYDMIWCYYYNRQQSPQMSTALRLKAKKLLPSSTTTTTPSEQQPPQAPQKVRPKIFPTSSKQSKQHLYQEYVPHKECNPNGVQFTLDYFPANYQIAEYCSLPIGFSLSPMLALDNQQAEVMDKSIDQVPRCGSCRAYMNCYNRVDKDKFHCFICGCLNSMGNYNPQAQPNLQTTCPIYQSHGSQTYYPHIPSPQTLIFIFDVTNSPSSPQILHYASSAITEVLSRPEFDEVIIHIYAYDHVVYQFQMTGQEIKCVVIDRSVKEGVGMIGAPVAHCRAKLDIVFKALGDMCKDNDQTKGDFGHAFHYIHTLTRHTSARYYIIQISESLINEQLVTENPIVANKNEPQRVIKSLLQTKNQTFMQLYGDQMYNNGNNLVLFIFAKNYKNIKVFSDALKVLNCSLKYYAKQSNAELEKFYYQFSYLLGATFFKDVRTEFIINDGFHFTSIYCNAHRIRQHITFSCVQLEPTRQYFVQIMPTKVRKEHPLHCTVQVITNYRYKQQHFISVATIIQTISQSQQRIYSGINSQVALAMSCRSFLSVLRTQTLIVSRRKQTKTATDIFKNALQHFKTKDKIPDSIMYLLQGILSITKSLHSQLDMISNSVAFDRVCAERNYLQFCSGQEISSFFVPYLFDLSHLEESMCQDLDNFVYPPTVQMRFANVKVGVFLMDNGLALYLYIAKHCDLDLLKNLLGKQKISKNDHFTQEILQAQSSRQSQQVLLLVHYLRQQKSYGWVPLYIVHCGQNSPTERMFYLSFTAERYDQFCGYKGSFEDYLDCIEKSNQSTGL